MAPHQSPALVDYIAPAQPRPSCCSMRPALAPYRDTTRARCREEKGGKGGAAPPLCSANGPAGPRMTPKGLSGRMPVNLVPSRSATPGRTGRPYVSYVKLSLRDSVSLLLLLLLRKEEVVVSETSEPRVISVGRVLVRIHPIRAFVSSPSTTSARFAVLSIWRRWWMWSDGRPGRNDTSGADAGRNDTHGADVGRRRLPPLD